VKPGAPSTTGTPTDGASGQDPGRHDAGQAAAAPSRSLVHGLVEAQVQRTPDAVAVEFEDATLTYAGLDASANRLAHRLIALGAGRGSLVGICLERSPSLIVGVLAALKAGAAYVPLDPAYPRERMAAMIADARPGILLTENAIVGELPEHRGVTITVEEERQELALCPSSAPICTATPDDPAYVIYTSGSTGVPKGVVVAHAGVGDLATVAVCEFATCPGARVLQFANFSFDSWMAELVMALSVGGTLVLAPRERLANPDTLHAVLAGARIEVVTLPPSVLAVLDTAGLPRLRTVCSAGETCSWAIVERWWTPQRRVLNGYGPTECTVAVAYYRARPDARPAGSVSVPIGAPHAHKRAYVVDEHLAPVPEGTPGELLVGGVGIALGYLNRQELTAERFLPDPFDAASGGRVYRTGDLVRWLPEGVLEFLGRVDNQVKLRGFRIELGEIDAVLTAHPQVRDAIAVMREDRPGRRRIVAYVLGAATPGELRSHLRRRLPEWMVPSAVVVLQTMPLTPNGKVDVSALPAPELDRAPYAAPQTPFEQSVTEIFGAVLGIDPIGLDDSFFELGGDSLLATRAAARLAESVGIPIPVRLLFEAPDARELAQAILVRIAGDGDRLAPRLAALSSAKRAVIETRLLAAARKADVDRIPRRSPGDPAPLSFAQQRLWFLDQLHPGEHTYNAALPMLVHGPVDGDALQRALDAVVDRHEVMRTVYAMGADGEIAQVVLPAAHVDLTRLDLSRLPESERLAKAILVLRAVGSRPFDLAHDVTTRAALLRLDERRWALMIVSHHICCDGWSRDVLFRDVAAFYNAFTTGERVALPELPIQYADYALWQRRWLDGPELERQREHWQAALAGAPPTLDMPTDKPRPTMQSSRGALRWMTVAPELGEALVRLGREDRATLYQTLLAAYQALVFARSGQHDFLIGSPIANRQRIEVESLIGFFSNTLVVRAQVDGDPTFRELVRRVWESTVAGYAHQDLPFEQLVELLRPPRDASRNPLFQTNFRVQAVPPPRLSIGGALVEPLELSLQTSRFDFAMDFHAEADGTLRGYLEYNTDLFEPVWAEQMASDYLALLAEVVGTPDVPLSQLATFARITDPQRDAPAAAPGPPPIRRRVRST
jgi:amino acid adenylation domain-containing protein